MAKEIRIPVPGGIVGHGRTYSEVVLREPTFDEYFDIGDCVEHVSYPNGMAIPTINNEVVRRYVEVCLVEPKDSLLLAQGGLDLAKEVRQAIVGFIHTGSRASEGSEKLPQTSSGNAAKAVSAPAT